MNTKKKFRELHFSKANKLLEDIKKREIKYLNDIKAYDYDSYKVKKWKSYKRSRYVQKNLLSVISHPEILKKAYYEIENNKSLIQIEKNSYSKLYYEDIIKIISENIKKGTYEFSKIGIIKGTKADKKTTYSSNFIKCIKAKKIAIDDIKLVTDKIVKTAIKLVLINIYEPEFQAADFNYGFKSKKSCHQAINKIDIIGNQINYIIQGKVAYNNNKIVFNNEILMKFLSRRIYDRKFLKLIYKLLKTGIKENINNINSIMGVSLIQESKISIEQILSNIYFFEFDIFVQDYLKKSVEKYGQILKQKNTLKYKELIKLIKKCETNCSQYKNKLIRLSNEIKKNSKFQNIKEKYKNYYQAWKRETKNLMSLISLSSQYSTRFEYMRYNNDWIILLNGSLPLAKMLKRKINSFLSQELKLNKEKIKTTDPNKKSVLFLGYSIFQLSKKITYKYDLFFGKNLIKKVKYQKINKLQSIYRKINFRIPWNELIIPRLEKLKFCDNTGYPKSIPYLSVLDDGTIIKYYNQVLLALANFYSPFCPKSDINRLFYIFTYSCYKTLARRHRTSMPKIINKYKTSDFAVYYRAKNQYGKIYKESIKHYLAYKPPLYIKEPNLKLFIINNI